MMSNRSGNHVVVPEAARLGSKRVRHGLPLRRRAATAAVACRKAKRPPSLGFLWPAAARPPHRRRRPYAVRGMSAAHARGRMVKRENGWVLLRPTGWRMKPSCWVLLPAFAESGRAGVAHVRFSARTVTPCALGGIDCLARRIGAFTIVGGGGIRIRVQPGGDPELMTATFAATAARNWPSRR